MAEKRENSVLFSLRELRKIEDQRVQQEEQDVKKRAEEIRQKKLAEEQRVRDDAERRRQDAEDAERKRIEEEERQKREDELRLEETERRARIDAQTKLEEQRLRLEMEHKTAVATKKKPIALMVAAGLLLVLVAGLGVFAFVENKKHAEEAAVAQAKLETFQKAVAELERQRDEQQREVARLDEESRKALEEVRTAKDEEGRKRAEAHAAAVAQERRDAADRLAALKAAKEKAERERKIDTSKCPPNDPLCGIK